MSFPQYSLPQTTLRELRYVILLFSRACVRCGHDPSLGPQNAFVMNQGIRRQYHLMIALLCAVSDLLLICAGIFGGSALLMQSPWLLALVTQGGVAFLLWYGFGALKTAMSSNLELASAEVMKQGRWKIIVTMLAVTWLNPHVYLDTFVVLGSWVDSWTLSRNAGLRSVRSAPPSSGSLVLRSRRHGWHHDCVPPKRSALSIPRWGW